MNRFFGRKSLVGKVMLASVGAVLLAFTVGAPAAYADNIHTASASGMPLSPAIRRPLRRWLLIALIPPMRP